MPAAIAVELILNGEITGTGVHIPVIKTIYQPVINKLSQLGISMEEKTGLPVTENLKPGISKS